MKERKWDAWEELQEWTDIRMMEEAEQRICPATGTSVLAPMPLGKMGRRLQEIAEMVPEERPVDLYAALAEVAR